MLISKTVKMPLCNRNYPEYKERGYILPTYVDKYGIKRTDYRKLVDVKIEDVPIGSHIKVLVECDKCAIQKEMPYREYLACISNSGSYNCKACWSTGNILDSMNECGRIDLIERWDYERSLHPSKYSKSGHSIVYIKCPQGRHSSRAIECCNLNKMAKKGTEIPCLICDSFASKIEEEYGNEKLTCIWDFERNEIDPYEISCKSNKRVFVICDEHGSYETTPKIFWMVNGRCPICWDESDKTRNNSPRWNPEKTDDERTIGRMYTEYTEFLKSVRKRENNICQLSGLKGKICVHHLNGYANFPEERTESSNAVAILERYHKEFHSIYGSSTTKEQFCEYVGKLVIGNRITKDRYARIISFLGREYTDG